MADINQAFAEAVAKHQTGDLAAAEPLYRAILRNVPTHPPTLCNLGVLLARQDRHEDSERCYTLCVSANPEYADAHYNLGNLYRKTARPGDAARHYAECVRLNPNHASGYFNLGLVLAAVGDARSAVECFQRVLHLEPGNADAHSRLGDALLRAGRAAESVDAFRRFAQMKPDDPRGANNLALALTTAGQAAEAADLLQKTTKQHPTYPDAHNSLALALEALGRKDDALFHYEQAVKHRPDFADAWSNLGTNLTEQGRADEAVTALRRSVDVRPNPAVHSNLLLTLNYSSRPSADDVAAEHRDWAGRYAGTTPPSPDPADPEPNRRLKVGYLSGDFRTHTVAGFIDALLTHHDRGQFHVTAYANVARPDETTEKLKAKADDWRPVAGTADGELAQRIRDDRIDLLIDLSGHTAGNRLTALARRPAPVQMTLFGYPNTTGLAAVDYRVSDAISDPPGTVERLYTEKILRLPETAWVYNPPADAPPVTPLPAAGRRTFVFGCLNNSAKISDACFNAWAGILKGIPGSRLVLLAGQSQAGAKRLADRFAAANIVRDRVQLVFRLPRNEYYETYQLFDLALDPFPYNGGVTTCDALWMGCPVLTVAGGSYVSRQGAMVMTQAGLPEFVAESADSLVELARTWNQNREFLADIRAGLRDQLRKSPIADPPRYVRNLEAGLRQAWRDRLGVR